MVPLGSSDIQQSKRALRDEMRERRLALTVSARHLASREACDRLLGWLASRGDLVGKTVGAYVAVRGELDPAAAVEGLRARGARIALPHVLAAAGHGPDGSGAALGWSHVEAGTPLRAGRFGIPEPDGSSFLPLGPGALDAVIVPGFAFDAEGRRLGSGGGYYDAAFAARSAGGPPLLLGLAYDFQVVDRCPAEAHDVPMDLVITESRVLGRSGPFGPKGRA